MKSIQWVRYNTYDQQESEESTILNIDAILRRINGDLVPHFEERLRAYLADQDRKCLIEQIVRLTLDAPSLEEMDRKHIREGTRRRKERLLSCHSDS